MHLHTFQMFFAIAALACSSCRDERQTEIEEEMCDLNLFEDPIVAALKLRTPRSERHPEFNTPELAVARADNPDEYEVGVIMHDPKGRQIFREGVTWELEGDDAEVFELVETRFGTPDTDFYRGINALQDFFDAGKREPEAELVACVKNVCSSCPPECTLEICTEPLNVRAVVNLQGDWWLSGDPLPPGKYGVEIAQTGREIEAIGFDIAPTVLSNTVSFRTNLTGKEEQCFEGTIAPSRDRIEGTVWACKSEEDRGTWLADRAKK